MLVNLDTTFARTVWLDPVPTPPTPGETADLAQLVPSGRVVDRRRRREPGVAIAVYPQDADSWVLVVSHAAHDAFPGRLAVTPDSRELVVFDGGQFGACFVVSLVTGDETRELDVTELRDVRTFRDPDLLLVVDLDSARAFGEAGFLWETRRLVLDDLELVSCDGDRLHAKGYGPFGDAEFTIDLTTGAAPDAPI